MAIKVVVIGGGTGNYSILSGLKAYKPLDLTAIVSMMDDGGSTGILRNEFGILPPGDIRQCLVALSEESELILQLFQHRFEGSLGGHNFGNLFHLALSQITGSEESAIAEMSKILKIAGKVLPVTLNNVSLKAELEDGTLVTGETNIDLPKHNPNLRIERLFTEPAAQVNPAALEAIEDAEYIVISPGDLYTSIIPNFLVSGVTEAIFHSGAMLISVCNMMTKYGETTGFTASDHVRVLHEYLRDRSVDVLIVNRSMPSEEAIEMYKKENSIVVEYDAERIKAAGVRRVIESDVMSSHSLIRHDPMKVAWEIFKTIQENELDINSNTISSPPDCKQSSQIDEILTDHQGRRLLFN
ncbi:MAG: YvcK family protein [Myxococcota bacterium]|nr:YvcK family protein [Myxococcota bacterium]